MKVYGAKWCVPCKKLTAWLDKLSVSYEYVDVDEAPGAMDILSGAGIMSLPAIEDGEGNFLTGPFRPDDIREIARH